jgi:hypothetical protein
MVLTQLATTLSPSLYEKSQGLPSVLSFLQFKDGKIISMETGATPLSDDYKLVGSE